MKLSSNTRKKFWTTIKSESWERLVLFIWVLFAAVFLAIYYRQVWPLFRLGLVEWVKNKYSLLVALRYIVHLVEGISLLFPVEYKEAGARNAAALVGCGVVISAALGYGRLILQLIRIHLDSWSEALLFQVSLGLGALAYLSLGLAVLGIYRRDILIPMVILSAAGMLIWLLFVHSRSFKIKISKTRVGGQSSDLLKAYLKGNTIWIIPLSAAILMALVGALAPEIEYDSLWYHLWLPKKWLESGHPIDIVSEYISLYPLTWELVYGAAMTIGGPIAAKLVHWACLPLTGLLVFRFARRFFPHVSPLLATVLFVTIPTVFWEATTAYNDLALTFFSTLALYACLCFIETRRQGWLALGGAALSLALAIKHLAFFILFPLSAGLAYLLWIEERNLRKVIIPVLLLVGISLLIPLPWYLRSWMASGNPFFPDLYHLFGAYPPERWSNITQRGLDHFKDHFGDTRTPLNLVSLPWNITVHAARYGGSLGPLFLLLLPGLFLSGQRKSPARLLLAFSLAYLALWASPLSSFQLRFLLPITPALSILGAEAFGRLARALSSWKIRQGLPEIFLAGLLLLNLPPFLSLHETDRTGYLGWLTHVVHEVPLGVVLGFETQESYLSRKVPSYRSWRYINRQLPENARILTFSGGDHYYSERERIWSDATIAYPAIWGAQRGAESQALARLRRLGITHLLVDRRQAAELEPGMVAILEPEVLQENFQLEYEDERFSLYRVAGLELVPILLAVRNRRRGAEK